MNRSDRREAAAAAVLVLVGAGLRLLLVSLFPTEPLSDFRGLVLFGVRLRDEGLAVPGWHWVQFSPGLPLILSGLFRVFPHGVAAVARTATAVATGLLPLAPFLLWRRVLGLRARVFAGALLALWPGQVFFSGVPAQENWATLPVVVLACLAARRLRLADGRSSPVAAGLLFALAAAIRQELLVVMLVPALAAAGLPGPSAGRGRRLLALGVAAFLPLLALAAERRAATGRFSIVTEHGGLSLLGTVVPGSAAAGWTDPMLYAAAIDPAYLRDPARLRQDAGRLAFREWRRRWRFHAYRAAVSSLVLSIESDRDDLYWSLQAPGALPPRRAAAGAALARRVGPWLRVELAVVTGAFVAAAVLGWRRRDRAILVIASAVLVKLLVQVLFSPLGRLMVPGTALELLAIALGAAALAASSTGRERTLLPALALGIAAALLFGMPPLRALAVRKDERPPAFARFPLGIAGAAGVFADCTVESGRMRGIGGDRAWVDAPASPARTRVACRLPALAPDAALGLDLEAADAVPVRVEADGREHEASAPGATPGWRRAELARAGAPPPSVVVLEADGPFGFGLVRRSGAAPALPRDRVLP